MSKMESNLPFVTRQDIINFPFPYKLWLVVNLEYVDFVHWNRDGTVILLDLVALEDYLNSSRSIFKVKNSSTFLKHLEEFNFERLNSTPEAEEDLLLQYKNENFQRHRLDLLAKIRRHTYQLLEQFPTEFKVESLVESKDKCNAQCSRIEQRVSERMLGDLCFMFHGGLSKIKKSRLRFQTILQYNNVKRILREKLTASELNQETKSKSDASVRSAAGTLIPEEDQVIELPVELFENPHDSVLSLSEDFLPEYAGYYGNCSNDQIMHFFGEYLPKYEDNSMEVKKIMTDNTGSCNNSFANITHYYSPNENQTPNIIISTPIAPNAIYNLNISSNLEPIFITNESSDNINLNYDSNNDFAETHLKSDNSSQIYSNNLSTEEDISMEEFLKFKTSNTENVSTNCQERNMDNAFTTSCLQDQENTKPFPQMPASFQMELNEDVKENEANFRNFFSQYRASLNLLYDRQ